MRATTVAAPAGLPSAPLAFVLLWTRFHVAKTLPLTAALRPLYRVGRPRNLLPTSHYGARATDAGAWRDVASEVCCSSDLSRRVGWRLLWECLPVCRRYWGGAPLLTLCCSRSVNARRVCMAWLIIGLCRYRTVCGPLDASEVVLACGPLPGARCITAGTLSEESCGDVTCARAAYPSLRVLPSLWPFAIAFESMAAIHIDLASAGMSMSLSWWRSRFSRYDPPSRALSDSLMY